MNRLEALVREEIERDGPIPVARWMQLCLLHPEHGYYTTRRPIGAATGDFVTAPEVSQMFGELVAVWAASVAPEPFALVECGPGRGTLARDMVRVLRATGRDVELHLVEASPSLRAEQRETLGPVRAAWHDTATAAFAATDRPLVLVANEFLDALPARQFVRRDGAWRERAVGVVDGRMAFVLAPGTLDAPAAPDGTVREIAPAREAWVAEVAQAVRARGAAALLVDYGSLQGGTGDTLQAVRAHRFADPLEAPGEADLTTQVDFAPLLAAAKAEGCAVAATTQGAFLLSMGLLQRAGRLGHAHPDRQERLQADVERLAGPDAMGDLFKVAALWHPDRSPPPGFSEGTPS